MIKLFHTLKNILTKQKQDSMFFEAVAKAKLQDEYIFPWYYDAKN